MTRPTPLTDLSKLNMSALYSAQYDAEQTAKALSLAFWLRDTAPASAAYHLADAYERFARFAAAFESLELPVEDAPVADEVF